MSCFLLDGKTILPIDNEYQLLISNKSHCFSQDLHSVNNNHTFKSNKEKEHCACFLPSHIEKESNLFETTRSTCRHPIIDRLLNKNNETYLITRLIPPSMNLTINSTTQEENNLLPSATTIIIKPFISYENSSKTTFHHKKSSLKRCKSSLSSSSKSSLLTVSKHISTHPSQHRIKKHRLSTFKDLTRSIPNIKTNHENQSSNFLHSRTLLTIYQNKKQMNK